MGEESINNEKEKCFVIMPISDQGDYPKGHFKKVYEQIFVPAIEAAGYDAFRVDEDNMCTPIVEKIFKAIQECPMALCDLSNRNPNVLYELGIRQAYDKPVVLVQDEKSDRIFDISGINTISYKSSRLYEEVLEAREKITDAIKSKRDGEQNSIIKVLKAQAATTDSGAISTEDKIEILLSGLVRDVNELKNQYKRKPIEPLFNNRLYNYYENAGGKYIIPYENMGIGDLNEHIIELKSGITNNEITHVVNDISRLFDAKINYTKEGKRLLLVIETEDSKIRDVVYKELRRRLGYNK